MKLGNFASKAFIRWFIETRDRREWRKRRREERRERVAAAVEGFTKRREALKALGLGAFIATAVSAPALANTVFTAYTFPGAGFPTSRTMPARIADIYCVKEFGALGDFVHNDTTNIQAAFAAMISSGGGVLFFPPGQYNVSSEIDITTAGSGNARIVGSSRGSTTITGTVNNGFIFAQDGGNGPTEISYIALNNLSTWIGSGALRINNTSMFINQCGFRGMINILCPYNIYDTFINGCSGVPGQDVTTGTLGTLAIAGYAPHIMGWRSTVGYQAAFQLWGSNGCALIGNGIENCGVAMLLGMHTGWASHCTVSGDVLTVGGTLGDNSDPQFGAGMQIFGRGLLLPPYGQDPNNSTGGTTIIANLTGSGGAGTYRLSNGGYSISTPVPMWTRFETALVGVTINSLQNEGCHYGLYSNSIGAAHISAAGGNSAVGECVNEFAGITGFNPQAGFYIRKAGATVFSGCSASNNCILGSWAFDPSQPVNNLTLISCQGQRPADNAITASISGTVLTVTVFTSGPGLAIGMPITGAGVSANTRITGSSATDGTLTGYNSTGTYRVNNSQTVGSESMVSAYGPDWLLPTTTEAGAGLQFINCGSVAATRSLTLATVFTALPGEAGSSTNMHKIVGDQFTITDGAKSGGGAAAFGDATQGGGSQIIKVWWNGTSWIRNG